MTAYYNEIDPYAAQWLRNLIAAGHIAPGDVDERSIEDVKPDDLRPYTQCHFFAGIGGWSLAARLAGWPDDRPLWTGSCPCQPFSAAGRLQGTADSRHLWPVFASLIRECGPPVVAGEQVASKAGLGWFDGVLTDLEAARYTVWAADFCAAGVGAPHIRQRLWWLADADQGQCGPGRLPSGQAQGPQPQPSGRRVASAWDRHGLVPCDDGSTRRIEPGVFPLAHGVPGRMGRLRAYGNAIVPQVAAEILSAYLEGPDADV